VVSHTIAAVPLTACVVAWHRPLLDRSDSILLSLGGEAEGERESQADSPLNAEPNTGLDLTTLK